MILKKRAIFLFFYWFTPLKSQVIIFDFNNLLVEQDSRAIADELGWGNLMRYTVMDIKNPLKLTRKLTDILQTMPPSDGAKKKKTTITDDLFAGKITHQELLRAAFIYLEELLNNKFFSSPRELELVEKLLGILYHPATYVSFLQPIPEAVDLVQKCARQTDASGSPAHTLMIFADWFPAAIDCLCEAPHLKKLFKLFARRHIMATGDLGCRKTDPHALENFIKTFDLAPQECIIIDTQESVVADARALGAQGIYCTKSTLSAATQELKRKGIIS